ncbi:MAG TPA: FGGY family carbohydrate kinase [Candidatus Limnocylindrales bacterium]
MTAGRPLALAIDVGTSSVRAGILDDRGRRRAALAQVAYPLDVGADGRAEIGVEVLVAALGETIDAAVGRAGTDIRRVVAVGMSCFLHSVAAIDGRGRPLTPLLTWADTTSAPEAAALRARLDAAALWQETGCPLHASYWPAKIARLRTTTAAARRFAGAPELLFRELTGETAVDLSLASGSGLLDRRTAQWHEGLLESLGIDAAALPPIAPRAASARLRAPAADRWPTLATIPWFVPWSDASCGTVGLGVRPGRGAALQLGTSGALRILLDEPAPTVPEGLFGHRLADGRSLVGGQLSEGGGVAAAIAGLLGRTSRDLEGAARRLPPDGHGLTVLPYLAGERGPGYDASRRGLVTGLSLATTGADVYLATLESIALRFAALDARLHRLAGGPPDVVGAGGALVASPRWPRIVAAALGRPMRLSTEGEASTRGAALQALAAAGAIETADDVPPPPSRRVQPDPDAVARYRDARARQERLYAEVRM